MAKFKTALVSYDGPTNTNQIPEWVKRQISDVGVAMSIQQCDTSEQAAEQAADADLVWVYGGGRVVTAEVLDRLTRCVVILRSGSGTDNIPVAEATDMGILVANTPQATVNQVSDHAIALLFSIFRWVPRQDQAIRRGIWDRDHAWPDWHIGDSTLGLIGFGRIPRMVVQKLGGFKLPCLAYDPFVGPS